MAGQDEEEATWEIVIDSLDNTFDQHQVAHMVHGLTNLQKMQLPPVKMQWIAVAQR